jgi:hypothetical protein
VIFNPSLSCLVVNKFRKARKYAALNGIDIRDGESLGRFIATAFSGVGGIGTLAVTGSVRFDFFVAIGNNYTTLKSTLKYVEYEI